MKGRRISFLLFCMFSLVHFLFAQDRGLEVLGRQVTGKANFDIGRQYAVIIGIDAYKEWPSLRGAVAEATAVRKVLSERYYIDQFFELYDADATAVGIRRLFTETLPGKIGVNDSLLVFYAGHGQIDTSKTGFWIASDGSSDQLSQNNWIPNAQLRNMIGNLKAQRILILTDSCFSGDFLNVSRGFPTKIDTSYYAQALQLTSRQVLTSGASEAVPDASEFGQQLINVLERNTEAILDPVTMYESIKRGVTQTLPLLGTLPGNQDGASFALFLRSGSLPGAAIVGNADLLVRSDEGAHVYVDGDVKGVTPLLLKGLDAGRTLQILVRTKDASGNATVLLAPGELRELTVSLSALTGNLFVVANESDVSLWIDGTELGPLASGVFKGISVGPHALELKAQGLYGKATVTVVENGTNEVHITTSPVGTVECQVPSGVSFKLTGKDFEETHLGAGAITNVPVGEYKLSAGGDGYYQCDKIVFVQKGDRVSWTPYSGGAIEFAVTPAGVRYSMDGDDRGVLTSMANNITPGLHSLVFSAPGYKDTKMTVSVERGKLSHVETILERYTPARIRIQDCGVILACVTPGADLTFLESSSGFVSYSVSSRLPLKISFSSPYAEAIDVPVLDTSFSEGESRDFEIPMGRISLPWIPPDATVSIGSNQSASLSNEGESGFQSKELPSGSYTITVSGLVPYSARVLVRPGAASEPDRYRELMNAKLNEKRSEYTTSRDIIRLAAKKKSVLSFLSLGASVVATGVSIVEYGIGKTAYASYLSDLDSSDASDDRSNAEHASRATIISGSVAVVGLLGASYLFFTAPKTTSVDVQMKELDRQIELLSASASAKTDQQAAPE